jgi:hypothetical protein
MKATTLVAVACRATVGVIRPATRRQRLPQPRVLGFQFGDAAEVGKGEKGDLTLKL